MSKSKKFQKKKHKNKTYKGILGILPLAAILGILPLIVYMRVIPVEPELQSYWTDVNNVDFFHYYKSQFLVAMASITLIILGFTGTFQWKVYKKYYILTGLLAVTAILSTIFTSTPAIATSGFYDRYEGIYATLSYLVIFLGAMHLVNTEKQVKFLIGTLVASATVMSFVGLSQFLNRDIFATDFFRRLILPREYHHIADEVSINFGARRIYGTLYNPNYVGSYVALMFPLGVVGIYYFKKLWQKSLAAVFIVLQLLLLLGSQSRAGFVGVAFSFLVLLLFYRKTLIAQWKQSLAAFLILLMGFVGVNTVTEGLTFDRIFDFSIGESRAYRNWGFEGIDAEDNELTLTMSGESMTIEYIEGEPMAFYNESGEELSYSLNNETQEVEFDNEDLDSFDLALKQYAEGLVVEQSIGSGRDLHFLALSSGFYLLGPHGETPAYEDVPSIGFENSGQFASGRGHIWSRTFPLLTETLLIGHGPDTFPLNFPQEDYIGKLKYHARTTIVVDKVHNMYLQSAVETGVLSALAMIILFGIYLWESTALYLHRKKESFIEATGLILFIATIGYLLAGIFNDSAVSVAPIFWILLGMGVAVNKTLEKEDTL
ncbi:O-antigen ligase family protein [Isachenkonia alkalipeptolytica]|uniref:Uncharacterized protein n=1 Tax=Isachenkonia alkalipeptolytica TaxID=2565777 RepID=A0AA43XM50_9CLOT|nr:O-antigen ligase family protein [Isachenkonia alkalipeptolytica]NBG88879.1 hypothetical protein [Isachenkonia alkalipeptolytica]